MINMGYCRFRNTLEALEECSDELAESELQDLSNEERIAARKLLKLCRELADEFCED